MTYPSYRVVQGSGVAKQKLPLLDESATRSRERYTVAPPIEQQHAVIGFRRLDAAAERGLRQPEHLCRAHIASTSRERDDMAQPT